VDVPEHLFDFRNARAAIRAGAERGADLDAGCQTIGRYCFFDGDAFDRKARANVAISHRWIVFGVREGESES
jgi:hypothetical protein